MNGVMMFDLYQFFYFFLGVFSICLFQRETDSDGDDCHYAKHNHYFETYFIE